MKTFLTLFAIMAALTVGGIGCKSEDNSMHSDDPKMMSEDACLHCAGVQTLKADGTCASCGMKMKG